MPKAVPIELDKPRRLRFDINALSDAEEALGTGLGTALQGRAGIREVRALLWAGLKWEDRGLTLQQAGAILQGYLEEGGSLEQVSDALSRAIAACGLLRAEGGNVKAEAAL